MTIELLTIAGGIVLLILSALGGGIEAKEIKIPQLPIATRVFSALAGVALISLGIMLKQPTLPTAAIVTPTTPLNLGDISIKPATAKVVFTITDRLGSEQISESIEVFMEGTRVGLFEITKTKPVAVIELSVPTPDTYQYRMSGSVSYQTADGPLVLPLEGSGSIEVKKGAAFFVNVKSAGASGLHAYLSTKP